MGWLAGPLVGAATGSLVVLFNLTVDRIQLASSAVPTALLPAAGGAGVALARALPAPAPLADLAASVLSLGTRASLGPEGPAVDAGKAVSRSVSNALNVDTSLRNTLAAAGAAAGLAGGFGASVSGAFFALEVQLQRGNESRTASANILLASAIAGAVSRLGLGDTPAFALPEYELRSVLSLPLYLPVGVLSWAVAWTLSASTAAFSEGIQRNTASLPAAAQPLVKTLTPSLGGLFVGVITVYYPLVAYAGFANFEDILWLREPYTPEALLVLVAAKVVATAASRSVGLAGGLYAPSLFLGACTGGFWGLLLTSTPYISQFSDSPQAYAIVGMASALGAVCKVPLTAILLTCELTRDYLVILPLMTATAAAVLLPEQSDRILPLSNIIKEQQRPLIQPSRGLDERADGNEKDNELASPSSDSDEMPRAETRNRSRSGSSETFSITTAKLRPSTAARLLERFPTAARSLRCGEAMDARIVSVSSSESACSVAERMASLSAPLAACVEESTNMHAIITRGALVQALLQDESTPARHFARYPDAIIKSNEVVFKALRELSQARRSITDGEGALALVCSEEGSELIGFMSAEEGSATTLALAAFTGDTGGRAMSR